MLKQLLNDVEQTTLKGKISQGKNPGVFLNLGHHGFCEF
jgi:hypothetical protein